jgi:RimJ/RimL family protein N-acetyltransferase
VIESLSGTRLQLQPLDGSDEAVVVALYSDPETMRHIAAAQSRATAQRSFAAALRMNAATPPRRRTWAMRLDGTTIGVIGLVFDADGSGAELGVVLPPTRQGRGFATEAISALADHAFATLALRRLHTRHDPAHALAAGLMTTLGFARSAAVDGRMGWTWCLTPERWQQVRDRRRPAVDPLR